MLSRRSISQRNILSHVHSQASVITRFAPSPIDLLDIGGARAALVNTWRLRQEEAGLLMARVIKRLGGGEELRLSDTIKVWVRAAMDVLKEGVSTLADLQERVYFLLRFRPFELNGGTAKTFKSDALDRLAQPRGVLTALPTWGEVALGDALRIFCRRQGGRLWEGRSTAPRSPDRRRVGAGYEFRTCRAGTR